MVSENLLDKHVPDIVGAIFRRLGRSMQDRETEPARFALEGKIKHVEIARRTFALHGDRRQYCISWDDETACNGTAFSTMHGVEVMVHACANIVGLYAESITAVEYSGVRREGSLDEASVFSASSE